MSFNCNFTGVGIDSDVYITVNSALHVGLFVAIIAPALVLCVVCAMAIVTTPDINWQMRVLLFNIFSVEVCNWLAFSVEFLGFPSRALNEDDTLYSCRIFLSLLITSTIQKYFAISFYSIMVYLFLKYGVKKLNLCAIISFVVVTWAFSIASASVVYFDQFEFSNRGGFCSSSTDVILYQIPLLLTLLISFIGSGVILTFSTMFVLFFEQTRA